METPFCAVVLILTFALDWFYPVGGISLPEVAALSGILYFYTTCKVDF